VVLAGDRGSSVGERCEPLRVADEDVASVYPKGPVGEVSPLSEVGKDLVQAAVGAGDGAGARHCPHDVGREDLAQQHGVAAAVVLVLRVVKLIEQLYRPGGTTP